MDGCAYEEMTSTEIEIFIMDEYGASRRQSRTILYEDEQRQPREKILWKALKVNMLESQGRPRQFKKGK